MNSIGFSEGGLGNSPSQKLTEDSSATVYVRLCYLIAGYHLTNTPSQDGYTTNYSPGEPNSHRKSPSSGLSLGLCKHHSNETNAQP